MAAEIVPEPMQSISHHPLRARAVPRRASYTTTIAIASFIGSAFLHPSRCPVDRRRACD
ncbi:Hypothetical protein A7982_00580 [Minicystis rosea]|nr:Hypothetical protein A7982_00580 [Minicystis rosea]